MKKEVLLSKTYVVVLLAMLCCLLWGSATPSIKIGYELFHIDVEDTASIMLFAGIRFILAGVMVLLFQFVTSRDTLKWHQGTAKRIMILALTQTFGQYFFFYIGLAHTTGVKGAIITGFNVFLAILVSSLWFHFESLNRKKVIGCLLGFVGIVVINLTPNSEMNVGFSILGEGFVFLAQVAYAFSSALIKKFSAIDHAVMLSGSQFLLGGSLLALTGVFMGGHITVYGIECVLILCYLAFISAVAYTVWGILLKYHPVSKVSIYGFMNPMFGVFLSAVVLGEGNQAFSVQGLLALCLVVLGIVVVNRVKHSDDSIVKNI